MTSKQRHLRRNLIDIVKSVDCAMIGLKLPDGHGLQVRTFFGLNVK